MITLDLGEQVKIGTLAVQKRLNLTAPQYQSWLASGQVVEEVLADVVQYPAVAIERLIYRRISGKIYAACQSAEQEVNSSVYEWLSYHVYRQLTLKIPRIDRETALDLTQETLCAVVTGFETCQSQQAFLTWVNSIAVRLAYKTLRKQTMLPLVPENPNEEQDDYFENAIFFSALEEDHQRTNPEQIVISREKMELILKKIMNLKTTTKRGRHYQQVLLATYFLELTDQELADALSLPVQEVQRMRYQAIQNLRRDQDFLDSLR
jgi:RNA polymerase sigma factor (sigma-70 family)